MTTYYMNEEGKKVLTKKLGAKERFVEYSDLTDELKEEAKKRAKLARISSKQRLGGILYHASGEWVVVLEDMKRKNVRKVMPTV